ncbi:MAG: type II toxin-antitoxin system RelE/ParE family toxin [Bacteroidota bacterium]
MIVNWSEHAVLALQDIRDYLSLKASRDIADRIALEIVDLTDSFVQFPLKFPACEEIPHNQGEYRYAVYKSSYRIIYKVLEAEILILDIFHNSRNPRGLSGLS